MGPRLLAALHIGSNISKDNAMNSVHLDLMPLSIIAHIVTMLCDLNICPLRGSYINSMGFKYNLIFISA